MEAESIELLLGDTFNGCEALPLDIFGDGAGLLGIAGDSQDCEGLVGTVGVCL